MTTPQIIISSLDFDDPHTHSCSGQHELASSSPIPFALVWFRRRPEAVRDLRKWSASLLSSWGLADSVDDVVLLLSELATNAIRYGDGDRALLLISYIEDRCAVRVEIVEASSTPATVKEPDAVSENGRGMFIVDAYASDWGVGHNGSSTWFEVSTDQV